MQSHEEKRRSWVNRRSNESIRDDLECRMDLKGIANSTAAIAFVNQKYHTARMRKDREPQIEHITMCSQLSEWIMSVDLTYKQIWDIYKLANTPGVNLCIVGGEVNRLLCIFADLAHHHRHDRNSAEVIRKLESGTHTHAHGDGKATTCNQLSLFAPGGPFESTGKQIVQQYLPSTSLPHAVATSDLPREIKASFQAFFRPYFSMLREISEYYTDCELPQGKTPQPDFVYCTYGTWGAAVSGSHADMLRRGWQNSRVHPASRRGSTREGRGFKSRCCFRMISYHLGAFDTVEECVLQRLRFIDRARELRHEKDIRDLALSMLPAGSSKYHGVGWCRSKGKWRAQINDVDILGVTLVQVEREVALN